MQQLNRIEPNGPPSAYQTYAAVVPRATHTRPATCAEVECEHHVKGWATTVAPDSDQERLMLRAMRGLVDGIRRHATYDHKTRDGFRRYVFPAGQACFRASTHRVPLERDPVTLIRRGDWRRQGPPQVIAVDEWIDRFDQNLQAIADRVARG